MNFLKNADWKHWALIAGAALTTIGTVAATADLKNPAGWVGVIMQTVMAIAAVNKLPPAPPSAVVA